MADFSGSLAGGIASGLPVGASIQTQRGQLRLQEQQQQQKEQQQMTEEARKRVDAAITQSDSIMKQAHKQATLIDDPQEKASLIDNAKKAVSVLEGSVTKIDMGIGNDPAVLQSRFSTIREQVGIAGEQRLAAKGAGLEAGAKAEAVAGAGKDVASFQNFDTGILAEIPIDDPDFDRKAANLAQQGFSRTKLPGVELTGTPEQLGLTKSQAGKELVGSIEAEKAVSQNILGLENIISLVASDEFIGGLSGDAVSNINSFTSQVQQLLGLDSIIKNGQLDESLLDVSSKNMSRFRKAAINNDRADSAIIELAYVKAKTLDPGGRVSDKDLAAAEKMLRSGADKASIINLLRDNQKRAVTNYNSDAKIMNKRLNANIALIKIEDILGGEVVEDSQSVKSITDKILQLEGL